MSPPRDRSNRVRGVPPPPLFSLMALPDDTLLTQIEVAGYRRVSVPAVEQGRYKGTDGLEWKYIKKWPRCTAGSLKKLMAGDPNLRRPPVPPKKVAGVGA